MAFLDQYKTLMLLLVLPCFCQHGLCEVVYIKPTRNTPCSFSPCVTFMQFLNSTSPSIDLNVTLILLSGNHNLNTQINVANKIEFSMLRISNTSLSSIACNSLGSLHLNSVQAVKINGVSFVGCGCNVARSINSLVIQDSSFVDSSKSCDGGAWSISNSNNVTINNCTFANYQITGSFHKGGALYINGTNATICKSVFKNNLMDGAFVQGGAVYVMKTSLSISECTFTNNHAEGSFSEGGAVYNSQSNSSISEATFVSNQACGSFAEGGAVYNSLSNSTIDDSIFTNNQASGSLSKGGAVYNSESNSSIYRSTFTTNQVNGSNPNGGAVYTSQSNSSISRSTFTDNQAIGSLARGGAVYNSQSNSSINRSTFTTNLVNGSNPNGGAVYTSQSNSSISRSTFTDNQAIGSLAKGGAVYNSLSNSTVHTSTFTNNQANGSIAKGSAVYIQKNVTSSSIFKECTFLKNMGSSVQVGALHAESRSTLGNVTYIRAIVISQCQFTESLGRAIYIENVRNTSIHHSIFTNHSNVALYSVFRDTDSEILVDHSSFSDNNGAIASTNVRRMIIYGCNFTNNKGSLRTVEINGDRRGVIRDTVTIDMCIFNNNKRGAVYCYNVVSLSVNRSTFNNNTSNTQEGVIYFSGRDTNVTLSHSVFSNNSALSCGVVSSRGLKNEIPSEMYSVQVVVLSNIFKSNTATGQDLGGGVGCFLNSKVSVVDSEFSHNSANFYGGVFHVKGSVLAIQESEFINNSATSDGGVAHVFDSLIPLKNSLFNHNQASKGGVLSLRKSNVTIDNCTFIDNIAGRNGGVLYFDTSPTPDFVTMLEIFNSNFSENVAATSGGILYANQNTIEAIISMNCLALSNVTEEGLFASLWNTDLTIMVNHNKTKLGFADYINACNSTVTVMDSINTISENDECQSNSSYCNNCITYIYTGNELPSGLSTCLNEFDSSTESYTEHEYVSEQDDTVTIVAVSGVCGVLAILITIIIVIMALVIFKYRRARSKSILNTDQTLEGEYS